MNYSSESLLHAAELPEEYFFTMPPDIRPSEIMQLRESVSWQPLTADLWEKTIESSLATVGIRDRTEVLIAIGFLAGNIRQGILCDINVHPDHQHKGLGTALVKARVHIADQYGMHLHIIRSDGNLIPYEELGFASSGKLLFRNHRDD